MNKRQVRSFVEILLSRLFEHGRLITVYLVIFDAVIVNLAYLLALFVRFDCHYRSIPMEYLDPWKEFIPFYTIFCLIVFAALRLYRSIWKYASFDELSRIILASFITTVFHVVTITILFKRMPISYYCMGAMFQFMFMLSMRFSYRFAILEKKKTPQKNRRSGNTRVMLIGAGQAGRLILRDMNENKMTKDRVVCIIDDNPNKIGKFIDGIQVVSDTTKIKEMAAKYFIDKICLAMPSASPERKRDILNICKGTGCKLKNLPGMYQLANGEVNTQALKSVGVEDLLGREPIRVNLDEIFSYITGKVILITGGGGSIGSELSRQIAAHQPDKLVIVDVYENNAYDIQQELKKNFPELDLEVRIASVRDSRKINAIFEEVRPDIVYHAAAHKHVPLMEDSPCEAIKNNAIGTYKTAYAAMANGCKRFVLISTDKAVNPTNIMGASKRICEMIIQTFDKMIKAGTPERLPILFSHYEDDISAEGFKNLKLSKVKTEFVAVRFGNVLDSNGSVIPLFKKQIEAGGPVTVTHPDIIRYFMTIPEAVSLVLQAGYYAKGGEIFVLDMGDPVKIDDLARNLIMLSGYKLDEEIKIEYIGLRPGEKLYEEKLMAEEGLKRTPNKLIHIGCPVDFDEDKFLHQLKELMDASYDNSPDIKNLVKTIVSTYKPEQEKVIDIESKKNHMTA